MGSFLISIWRREQDSNLREPCDPTRFPSVLLKPLGHLSNSLDFTINHAVILPPIVLTFYPACAIIKGYEFSPLINLY